MGLAFSPGGELLASASGDTTVLLWDMRRLIRRRQQPAGELTAKELNALWAALADDDAARAYRAIVALSAAPRASVPFLSAKVPGPALDAQRVAQWIRDLDSNQFAVRAQATEELALLGRAVEPALRQALAKPASAEARRRMERLLASMKGQVIAPAILRDLRAVEALEQAGTPEARETLKRLARGAPEARLTQEAKASLERLARRSASP
jgi:hypothetical protein